MLGRMLLFLFFNGGRILETRKKVKEVIQRFEINQMNDLLTT